MLAKTAPLYEPGDVIAGKYQVEALLGQGGMGAVFRARNIALDASVAIKVVRGASDKPVLHGRLLQEARAAAKLQHPNIVKVFDVGETVDAEPFIVMELLLGQSLGALLLEEQRLPAVQAVRLLLPIADALWLAHGKGIVHRDLKPDNVFIVENDSGIEPKLLDFGIVKLDESYGASHLTEGGAAVGSPDYMSPEQARGQDDITFASDVWSFSVMLYETISGRTPFAGANYNALMREIVERTPPTLSELSAADAELSAIVARGLLKDRRERFASMGEMGRALARWLVDLGVSEDITGATLEARWLRGDAHVRGGRASLSSIHDAWAAEAGSGVRPNAVGGGHTLRAPPPDVDATIDERATLREHRPPWRWIALAALLLVASGVGVGLTLAAKDGVRPAPSAVASAPAPSASADAVEAQADPVPSSPVATNSAAQPAPRGVPSEAGHASGAAPAKRAPRSAVTASGSPKSRPIAKPDDLLSPY